MDIHFVRLFVLSPFGDYNCNISSLYFDVLRQTRRQTVGDDGSVERKRVGGAETEFYQSLTSVCVTDERV